MEVLDEHLEETKQILIKHANETTKPIDESGLSKIRALQARLESIEDTRLMEIANERLKLFEEKLINLGFPPDTVSDVTETYKQSLIKFIGGGLKQYLLRG